MMKLIRILFCGALLAILGCNPSPSEQSDRFLFPQGVASGDPQPEAITLWTRIINASGGETPIELQVEMAPSPTFTDVVHSGKIIARSDYDFTIRYYAQGLESNQRYYYRFIAGQDTSMIGRTRTAPSNQESAPLRFGTLACQSYEQGFYGTLARMIKEDEALPEEDQLDVVFHLGDFIYEVVGDDPSVKPPYPPKWLVDRNGNQRTIPPFPDGLQRLDSGHSKSGSWYPYTIADYRMLYKTYLSNPVMIAARARWPFIVTWDDHEFADGNHQSYMPATKALGQKGMQKAKVAANQAWFEYIPAALDHATRLPNIRTSAHDFRPVSVENAPLGNEKTYGLYREANNMMAINSLCIYRALTWGKDILLIVTDTKSYQDPGASVLGGEQKRWFKNLLSLDIKWKLWANSEPIVAAAVDFDKIPDTGKDRELVYNDSWKQARDERKELLQFIDEQQIPGVVSLSGDYHIQMASTVEAPSGKPVMADFAVTAMSAHADFYWLERRAKGYRNPAAYALFAYPNEKGELLPNINTAVMYGARSATELAETGNMEMASALQDRTVNPGIQYFDCQHNGYLTGYVGTDELQVDFVNTANARSDFEGSGAPIVSKISFNLSYWYNQPPALSASQVSGTVFPGFW